MDIAGIYGFFFFHHLITLLCTAEAPREGRMAPIRSSHSAKKKWSPAEGEDLLRKGAACRQAEQYDEALELLRKACHNCDCVSRGARPRCVSNCRDWVEAARRGEMVKEAREGCRCAPMASRKQRMEAVAAAQQGQQQQVQGRAARASRSSAVADYECTRRWHVAALNHRVAIYIVQGRLPLAERAAAAMLESFPTMPDGYLRFAQVLDHQYHRQPDHDEDGERKRLHYRLLYLVIKSGMAACENLRDGERDAGYQVTCFLPARRCATGERLALTWTQRLVERGEHYEKRSRVDPFSLLPPEIALVILRLLTAAELSYVSLLSIRVPKH